MNHRWTQARVGCTKPLSQSASTPMRPDDDHILAVRALVSPREMSTGPVKRWRDDDFVVFSGTVSVPAPLRGCRVKLGYSAEANSLARSS